MECCHFKQHCNRPKCHRRCIGTYNTQYKVYENCCYSVYKVCGYCGHEYDHMKQQACPQCGMAMDDPPRFGGFRRGGFGRRFGGGFGRRFGGGFGRRFGRERFERFERFPIFFFPEFEEEEEEEF